MNRIPSREVPSIRAASSSSIGSVRKNWRSMKIPNALHRLGMISPPTLSTMPSFLTIRNVGISSTWKGTISVASSTTNSTSRPKNADPRERVGGEAAEQQVARHRGQRIERAVDEEVAERDGVPRRRVVAEMQRGGEQDRREAAAPAGLVSSDRITIQISGTSMIAATGGEEQMPGAERQRAARSRRGASAAAGSGRRRLSARWRCRPPHEL